MLEFRDTMDLKSICVFLPRANPQHYWDGKILGHILWHTEMKFSTFGEIEIAFMELDLIVSKMEEILTIGKAYHV